MLRLTRALDPPPVADLATDDHERGEEAESEEEREPDQLRELEVVGRPVVRAAREDGFGSPDAESDSRSRRAAQSRARAAPRLWIGVFVSAG